MRARPSISHSGSDRASMQTGNNSFAPIGGHLGGPSRHREAAASSSTVTAMTAEAATVGGGPIKPGDVFPDLHHKMSKKIAQLTKVIYHLNTKNEDRQARAACV